jgi:hypothetical protein
MTRVPPQLTAPLNEVGGVLGCQDQADTVADLKSGHLVLRVGIWQENYRQTQQFKLTVVFSAVHTSSKATVRNPVKSFCWLAGIQHFECRPMKNQWHGKECGPIDNRS